MLNIKQGTEKEQKMKKIHNFNVILTLFLLFLSLLSFNLSYAFNNETSDIEVWERQNIINSINFLESKSNNTAQRANVKVIL